MVVRYNKWKVLMATVGDNLTGYHHRQLEELHVSERCISPWGSFAIRDFVLSATEYATKEADTSWHHLKTAKSCLVNTMSVGTPTLISEHPFQGKVTSRRW